MPNYKTHLFFGFLFSLIAYIALKYHQNFSFSDLEYIFYIPAIFITSQLPDIDSDNSFIRKIMIVFGIIAMIALVGVYLVLHKMSLAILSLIVGGLLLFIILKLKHRGFMHTFLAAFLVLVPLIAVSYMLYFVCVAAYISHLVIDGKFKLLPG